jgi:hypothetical protein
MTKVSISQTDTLKSTIQTAVDKLSLGQHFMHVRTKNKNGNWSPFQFAAFFIEDTIQPGKITELEYFIDKDSLVGSMTKVNISAADTLNKTIRHDVAKLKSGSHYIHVRTKSNKGNWSPYYFIRLMWKIPFLWPVYEFKNTSMSSTLLYTKPR